MTNLHVYSGGDGTVRHLTVNKITSADLLASLASGWEDFKAMPTHLLFLGLIYPFAGIALAGISFGYNLFPLLFPLAAGFALIGPVAAIGLYELSRQRELGAARADYSHLFDVVRSPSFPAIVTISGLLAALFIVWLLVAQTLYQSLFGYLPPVSLSQFVSDVFNTPHGQKLIVFGNLIGLGFASIAMIVGVVSFPLLLDRDVGVITALETSIQAVSKNLGVMIVWGLMVAALLVLGSLPFLVGLAVIVPVLGHATWHLYRRLVAR